MKSLSSLAVALAIVLSSFASSVYATDVTEPNSTFNVVPQECATMAAKHAHPDWYRSGGYCSPLDFDSHSN